MDEAMAVQLMRDMQGDHIKTIEERDMLREALVDVKGEIDTLDLSIATSVYYQMRDVLQRTEEA